MRGINYISEGLAGNIHQARGILLIQPLKIRKPHSLELIQREIHFFQHINWNAPRLKVCCIGTAAYSSAPAGSRHRFL
jgi:hypothetical protein